MRPSGKNIPGQGESKHKRPGAGGVCYVGGHQSSAAGTGRDRRQQVRPGGDGEPAGVGPLQLLRKHGFDSEGDGKSLEAYKIQDRSSRWPGAAQGASDNAAGNDILIVRLQFGFSFLFFFMFYPSASNLFLLYPGGSSGSNPPPLPHCE